MDTFQHGVNDKVIQPQGKKNIFAQKFDLHQVMHIVECLSLRKNSVERFS